nr:carbamoyl phosphate synthase small subunit [Lachnospiraceae bacterium]
MRLDKRLVLEDGTYYDGVGFGADEERVCEIVFNTSMAGYQEILSDPSYTDQAIVMSYPLIGNYGIAEEDFESKIIGASAFVVRDINDNPSNFRSTKSVPELLEEAGVPGISGIDTRKLIRSIRDHGSRRCIITDVNTSVDTAVSMI